MLDFLTSLRLHLVVLDIHPACLLLDIPVGAVVLDSLLHHYCLRILVLLDDLPARHLRHLDLRDNLVDMVVQDIPPAHHYLLYLGVRFRLGNLDVEVVLDILPGHHFLLDNLVYAVLLDTRPAYHLPGNLVDVVVLDTLPGHYLRHPGLLGNLVDAVVLDNPPDHHFRFLPGNLVDAVLLDNLPGHHSLRFLLDNLVV